jgi:hypothetical protein
MKYRKKPVVIDASQWHMNGDHPEDYADRDNADGAMRREGMVVRYFRRPDVPSNTCCRHCDKTMYVHGWIDTLEGGHVVCPGDWIITGVKGERYPCKPDIFAATYELAPQILARGALRYLDAAPELPEVDDG